MASLMRGIAGPTMPACFMIKPRAVLKRSIRAVIGRQRWSAISRKLDKHPPPLDEAEMAAALKRAQRMLDSGRISEARAVLDGAWRPHHIRVPRRRQMAVLYQKAGALHEALRDWRNLLRKLPKNAMALRRIRDLEARIAMEEAGRDLEAGNHAAALRKLQVFLTKRPGHAAAARLLMTTHIRAGRPDSAEAMVAKAVATGKGGHQAMANLAMAYEAAGRHEEARRAWSGLAATFEMPLNQRIGRINKIVRKHPPKANAAATGREPVAGFLAEMDEAFRVGDERGLYGLLGRAGDDAVGEYYEIKLLNRATGLAQAAERAGRLLDAGLPPILADRESELREIQWRGLARLGRYQEAADLVKRLKLDPVRRAEAELDIWWRTDPARGLALVSGLWGGDRDPDRHSLLFCALPLILDDVAAAEKHLAMDLARREYHRLPVPNDLLLCAAELHRRRGDRPEATKLFSRLFNRQQLEMPGGLADGFDHLSLDLPSYPGGPLVTVILTAYNAERTLALALGSILAQTHGSLEVIAVDDASTDGTLDILLEAAGRDSRISVYQNRNNAGTYVSKNFAMRRARGEFITFMDADDWAHPRRVERHLSRMRNQPDFVFTTSDWIRANDEGCPQLRPWPLQYSHMNPGSFFFRREVLEQVGFFDRVRIDGDLEYLLRVRARYGPSAVGRIAAVLTIGRFRDDSLTRAGVGAQTEECYSQTRSDYRVDTLRWRRGRLLTNESLYLGPAAGQRDLPAARAILVEHEPDAMEIRKGDCAVEALAC